MVFLSFVSKLLKIIYFYLVCRCRNISSLDLLEKWQLLCTIPYAAVEGALDTIFEEASEPFNVGRPLLSVDMYEVEYMRSLGFTWTDISNMLNVSRSTLYRRLTAVFRLTLTKLFYAF